MYVLMLLVVLLAPIGVVATPTPGRTVSSRFIAPTRVHSARSNVVTPLPCIAMDPPPSQVETHIRFEKFAHAFIVKKNLTEAFEYVSSTYVNHNPMAGDDGPNAALDVLGPMWESKQFCPLRMAFKDDQGWLNYHASGAGEIVDRFRWEAGCIVEHWDQEEKFPEM